MYKIILLGEKGMLGNAVYKYFTKQGYVILTTSARWDSVDFRDFILKTQADIIINCIGKIPQRKPVDGNEYVDLNENLPVFLESRGIPVIHPSTDCEFSGELSLGLKYAKNAERDASDDYGKSKARISEKIESSFKNTKMIRTSIIGHELGTQVSLLDWFLSATDKSVKGYANHYWNGVTTLQWAKQAEYLICNWATLPTLNQFGTTENNSKYDLLQIIKRVYSKQIDIVPFDTDVAVNKCLQSDMVLPGIEQQLMELKDFYKSDSDIV